MKDLCELSVQALVFLFRFYFDSNSKYRIVSEKRSETSQCQ